MSGPSAAFYQGLSETGYIQKQNLAIEHRWAEGSYDRLPALAADLVGRKVEVIATLGMPAALAAKSATSTIPIVFNVGIDPVADGLVTSLARPGGNLTGVTILSTELMPKRLQLLSELVPQHGMIALLVNPNNASAEPQNARPAESGACGGGAAPHPEGQQRGRDRRRVHIARPIAYRRASRWQRCILRQPARAARGAGSTSCRSGGL